MNKRYVALVAVIVFGLLMTFAVYVAAQSGVMLPAQAGEQPKSAAAPTGTGVTYQGQ